jgi:hypothetical protein
LLRIDGKNILADRFRFLRFIQITVQLNFGEGLGDSRLGDGFQLVVHRTLLAAGGDAPLCSGSAAVYVEILRIPVRTGTLRMTP